MLLVYEYFFSFRYSGTLQLSFQAGVSVGQVYVMTCVTKSVLPPGASDGDLSRGDLDPSVCYMEASLRPWSCTPVCGPSPRAHTQARGPCSGALGSCVPLPISLRGPVTPAGPGLRASRASGVERSSLTRKEALQELGDQPPLLPLRSVLDRGARHALARPEDLGSSACGEEGLFPGKQLCFGC